MKNGKENCLNKEFIARINIDAASRCVFILYPEKTVTAEAELVGESFLIIVEMGY